MTAAMCCAVLTLAGCGGGGGGDAPTAGTTTAVTRSVTPQLSREQLKAVAASIQSDLLRARAVSSAAESNYRNFATLLAHGDTTLLCAANGAGTLALDVTDQGVQGQSDAGDRLAMQYQQCNLADIGVNETSQGLQTTTLTSVVGTPLSGTTWSAQMTMNWADLRTKPNNSLLGTGMNGTTTFALGESAPGFTNVTTVMAGLTLADYLDANFGGVSTTKPVSELAYQDFTLPYAADVTGTSSSVQGRTVYSAPQNPKQSPVTTTYATNLPYRTDSSGQPVLGDLVAKSSAVRSVTLNGLPISGLRA